MRLTSLSAFRNAGFRRRRRRRRVGARSPTSRACTNSNISSPKKSRSRHRDSAADVDRRSVPLRRDRPRAVVDRRAAGSGSSSGSTPMSRPTRAPRSDRRPSSLTPRVAITGGLRYTHERKTIDNAGGLYTVDAPATLAVRFGYGYTDAISHDAWTPKFGVEVRARDERAGVRAPPTRGFKSGGFNATSTAAGRGYGPEWAWSYEGGLKTGVGGGRARLNVAAFHTDYTDLQVQTPITTSLLDVSNAAAATIRGVELEATTLRRQHACRPAATWPGWTRPTIAIARSARRRHRRRRRPSAEQRPGMVGTRVDRLDARDRSGERRCRCAPTRRGRRRCSSRRSTTASSGSARWGCWTSAPSSGRRTGAGRSCAYARNLTDEHYITGSNSAPLPAIGGRPGDPRQVGVQLAIGR